MMRSTWMLALTFSLSGALTVSAAELVLEPADEEVGSFPTGYTATGGENDSASHWQVALTALPSAMQRISPLAPSTNRKNVIERKPDASQRTGTPVLVFDKESFDDFKLTTKLKIGSGTSTQTAGMVFRWQDPDNYYSVLIDTEGGWFVFRKVVNGQPQPPIGNRSKASPDTWHSLSLECQGPKITLVLNESEKIPALTDTQFSSGKLGFLTLGESGALFGDTRINYRPKIATAQRIVDQIMERFTRLIMVTVYARRDATAPATIIASSEASQLGSQADKAATDTLDTGNLYYARTKKTSIVTLPVKDRNGEAMAACRVEMKAFRGQTEQNAIARAIPVVKMIQDRALDRRDLFE